MQMLLLLHTIKKVNALDNLIHYIIRFLLGNVYSPEIGMQIGYTSNEDDFHVYKLIIIPSKFFDSSIYGSIDSLPQLPLNTIDDIPLLFGTPKIEKQDNRLIIHADIIASAYFLLSRYEEFVRKDVRDNYGRFPGKESLPFRAGFIHRPLVDEYGKMLRKWLREAGVNIPEPKPEINKIYLTHDVDIPYYYKGRIKSTLKGLLTSNKQKTILKSFFGKPENDPAFTFPWLIKQDTLSQKTVGEDKCEVIYFFKSGGKTQEDKPVYNLKSNEIRYLFSLCKKSNATIGLHASFDAGANPALIKGEKNKLERATDVTIRYNRHHFLNCREPEDMQYLIDAGISDDFTMGYADVAGFRLGTCRPVNWINPVNKNVNDLILHPLTIMECTLDRPEYMGLDYQSALAYSKRLIDQTAKSNGDLVLLWHNSYIPIDSANWCRILYEELLRYLRNY